MGSSLSWLRHIPAPDGADDEMPLSAYPKFRADTFGTLTAILESHLRAQIIEADETAGPVKATANRFKLPESELWFCSYGLPITFRFDDTEEFRVQFRLRGTGATRIGDERVLITGEQSCIAANGAEVDFGGGFQQIAWRVPRQSLQRKLAALTGRAATRPIGFAHALDMTTPDSAALRSTLAALLQTIDAAPPAAAKLVIGELESALMLGLLAAAQHSYRDALSGPPPAAAPWQVRRAESFIEAHWNEPLSMERLVEVTGASARSISRTFRMHRGYSPFEFAKSLRLNQARRLLSEGAEITVTAAALACGFENLSRFSKDFSAAFGEAPSAVLQRRRRTEGG